MTIEKYSLYGRHIISTFTEIFNNLADWDSKEEGSDGGATYNYGGAELKLSVIDPTNGYVGIQLTCGTKVQSVNISSSRTYINIMVIRTKTSVGIIACNAAAEGVPSPTYNSAQLCFVLTKCMNFTSGVEERGIVWSPTNSTITSSFQRLISSTSDVTSEATNTREFSDFINGAATVLYPACTKTYPGYCPHVFLPAVQTINSVNGRCTVDGKTYYVMQTSLYLLDD